MYYNAWVENADRNIGAANMFGWIDNLYGKSEGPVFVCGTGPSLYRDMEYLKRLFSLGAKFIAVDRAFPALMANGIVPHLVVTDDQQPQVAKYFKEYVSFSDTVFSPSLVTHPDVVKMFKGPITFHAPINPFSWFWQLAYQHFGRHIATNRASSVVTFSAVDIALWMGFNPIITIGNDGCFASMADLRKEVGDYPRVIELPDGRATHDVFMNAAHGFGVLEKWHPEVRFIDLSDGICPWERCEITEKAG